MKQKGRRVLCAAAVAVAVTAFTTGAAGALTPANGGDAGGSLVAINNGAGDQAEPHVSGDLASYTNTDGTRTIHYFDVQTATDRTSRSGHWVTTTSCPMWTTAGSSSAGPELRTVKPR